MHRLLSLAGLVILALALVACGPGRAPVLGGAIEVTVEGVPSAVVTIEPGGVSRTVSADSPERFEDVTPGVYTVSAEDQTGFVTPSATATVVTGQTASVTLTFEADTDATVTVDLAGDNEVTPVATTATGSATATLEGNMLTVEGSFEGMESDLIEIEGSSGHIHEAPLGENGPVIFPLEVESTDDRSGTFSGSFELDEEQIAAFAAGEFYINLHTENNPGGELRGQLSADAPEFAAVDMAFDATLSGDNIAPEAVETDASGMATAILRGNELTISGSFEDLSSALRDYAAMPLDPPNPDVTSAAHIHQGAVGEAGPFVVNLGVVLNEDELSGRFSGTFELEPDQVTALMNGEYYVDIHTVDNLGGELRGQLFPRQEMALDVSLSGEQEVPPVMTTATGSATAMVMGNTLEVSGSFEGMESDLTEIAGSPGHIHEAPRGENGDVVFILDVASEDNRSGSFSGSFELNDAQRADFDAGLYYINLHTQNNQGGELRGQLEGMMAGEEHQH